MDKVTTYRRVIKSILSELAEISNRQPVPGVDTICVFDDDKTALRAEAELIHSPENLLLHAQLIGYYFRKRLCDAGQSVQNYRRHVFWLIRYHPDSPLAGEFYCFIHPNEGQMAWQKGKQPWLQQTKRHPHNPAILRNAARYLFSGSTYTYTPEVDKILTKVIALDPDDNRSRNTLGLAYIEKMGRSTHQNRMRWATIALEQYLILEQKDTQRYYRQTVAHLIPCLAYEGQRYDLAALYAQQLIRTDADTPLLPVSEHCGHFVLGRLALHQNNVEMAKYHLIAMAEVPPFVFFQFSGPFMRLANELLQRGERDVVLHYLSLCERLVMEDNREVFLAWKRIIEKGQHPDFADYDYVYRLTPYLS